MDPIALAAILTGIAALASAPFHLRIVLQTRDIVRAKVFLGYDRYLRGWEVTSHLLGIGVVLGCIYLAFEPDEIFLSAFFPFSVLTLAIFFAIIGLSILMRKIVR